MSYAGETQVLEGERGSEVKVIEATGFFQVRRPIGAFGFAWGQRQSFRRDTDERNHASEVGETYNSIVTLRSG